MQSNKELDNLKSKIEIKSRRSGVTNNDEWMGKVNKCIYVYTLGPQATHIKVESIRKTISDNKSRTDARKSNFRM